MGIAEQKAAREAAKLFKKAVYSGKIPLKTVRSHFDALLGVRSLPNNVDRREVTAGTVTCDCLVPELALGNKTVLYAHGGGFNSGSRFAYRNLCTSIAHESACKVLVPEYRLSPEYPFPTALEDLYNSYAWLLREGISPFDIVIAGDGAGGTLALSLVRYLDTRHVPLPAGLALISPWTDLTLSGSSLQTNRKADQILSKEILSIHAHQYTYQSNFSNPQVSPLLGSFNTFPPLFIQCGSEEALLDDSVRLAEKAKKEGVNVTLEIWDGMWHLFQAIDSLSPQAHLAIKQLGLWIRGLKHASGF